MSEPSSPQSAPPAPQGWARWLAFRAVAVVIGLSPFLLGEAGLRLAGWKPQSPSVDPYVGFHSIKPLFERTDDGLHYAVPAWRREFFEPEQFLAEKPPDEFRIFCLGGSTVQGRPYSIATSFSTWLELSLTAADSSRRWEVVNCGGVSYASYRLTPILQECLNHSPDLFIIYTGHNEFLEDRSYRDMQEPSTAALAAHRAASNSRLYQWTLSLRGEPPAPNTTLPQEVDALLDYRGGLETYHRDPAWRRQVVRHYDANIRRMIAIAEDAGVPVILVNPVSNLRDCPPFKVEPDPTADKASIESVEGKLERAKQLAESDPPSAIPLLREMLEIDSEHSAAWFLLGHCHLANHETEAAKRCFVAAKDFDVCPLRMTEPLHAGLRSAAADTGTPLVDAREHFETNADDGLVGDRQLIDHVHPRIEGHQQIAQLLMEELIRQQLVAPSDKWQPRRRELYRAHLRENVDETYMARGNQRLEGLKRWASGRAFKVRTP